MRSRFIILKKIICALCFLFFLSNCESSPEAHEQEPSSLIKTPNKSYIVEIKKMKFQPAELAVQKGDTVVWVNKDIVVHDVTEERGKKWTSSALAPGQSWSLIVTQSTNYFCSIHVVMKGTLTVQ